MNILKRELKTGRKAFILWSIGLFFIMFAGMTKFTGFSGDPGALEIFDSFPKIVLAVFGIVGVDLTTLGGFYAIVVYYGIICMAIYSVSLGCHAVNREVIDKTYEFIFTKPRSRTAILNRKLLAAFIYITLYSLLNYIFSLAVIATLNIENTITGPILLFTLSLWLIGLLFCTLAAFIAAVIRDAERGIMLGNLIFLATFILGMIYDMLENGGALRFLSPMKYFLPKDLLADHLDPLFLVFCLVLIGAFYFAAVRMLEKKDLIA